MHSRLALAISTQRVGTSKVQTIACMIPHMIVHSKYVVLTYEFTYITAYTLTEGNKTAKSTRRVVAIAKSMPNCVFPVALHSLSDNC